MTGPLTVGGTRAGPCRNPIGAWASGALKPCARERWQITVTLPDGRVATLIVCPRCDTYQPNAPQSTAASGR